MPRIAVGTEGEGGLDDVVSHRFGRAPKITIVDVDDGGNVVNVRVLDNPGASASGGAVVKAIQVLVNEGVDAVVGPAFGPNAQAILEEMKVVNLTIPEGTKVRDAVEAAMRELRSRA
ncbi:MAG TPA: dinitrogenase iron-molybdenum cofactor [Nitrososphaeria archaeon]|jgi:predicted Fe-Mo cluster-binding NifX family protein|nr:NifB/NifX family molybdenum-iron cluster-binding protein [Conexivisphaerales archaeon]HEU16146.1 dinitrogenase iron-molybdenum cofactor [Nitrososphaeria archaeon]